MRRGASRRPSRTPGRSRVNFSRSRLNPAADADSPGTMTGTTQGGEAEILDGPTGSGQPVIYIAGSGRSGSTIMERVLGEMPGFVNVGELIDLARRARDEERCGCGMAFSDCPFWMGVGERAFGGWDAGSVAATGELQGRVARQRHLPRLLTMRMAGSGFRADVSAYGAFY